MPLKILYAFATTESAEPSAIQIFKDSFETASGIDFDSIGEITIAENITSDSITQSFLQTYIDSDHIMLLRNTGVTANMLAALKVKTDILAVVPAGSNYYRDDQSFFNENNNFVVFCGSGLRGKGNATAYPCMFYDIGSTENVANPILDMRQYGETYTVTHIQRRSASVLAFKLQGVTDPTSIGLSDHQSPIVFANLSGSDISPLPLGVQVVTGYAISNGMFFISFNTSAGTINTGFTDGSMQTVSGGTMQFADGQANPTSKTFMRLTSGTFAIDTYGITLQNVTGFTNNPDGNYSVAKNVNSSSGWADMITFTHTLGSGAFTGGDFYAASESYSTPEIAGQLLAIKYLTGENWQKVLSRAIQTASNTSFDTYDGFGNIDVDEAVNRIMTSSLIASDLTAPVLSLGSSTDTTYNFSWTLIPGATGYEVYFRGELLETLPPHLTKYRLVLTHRYTKGIKNTFQVKATNGTDYASSNILEAGYYNYNSIAVNQ